MYNCLHGKELFLGASSHSANQSDSTHLLEPKGHYCINKGLSVHPTLSQINLFHNLTFHFLQINFNVILTSPKMVSSLQVLHVKFHVHFLSLSCSTY